MSRDDSGPTFWFVHAVNEMGRTCYAVSAWTERSARIQVRKQIGPSSEILSIKPVRYAHAWEIVTGRTVGRDNRLGLGD